MMFKKIIKSTAIACATLIALSATGCSDKSWAVKVNNVKIPVGVYVSYLYINRENVLYQASQSSSSTNALTGAASSSSDPWSQKIDNQTAYNWSINNALKSTEEFAVAGELCAKKKITLTADENKNLASYASQYMTQNTGFASNGITQASIEKYLSFYGLLMPLLINAYYGKSGENPVSDTDLKNYYTANFADIKQIYLTTIDDQGNALPDDQQKTIKAQADSIFAGLNADKTKFSVLQTQYDQDVNGAKANPAGYIFAKDESQLPASIFVSTAFTMNVGDVKEIQSDYGWHIIYKVTSDTSDSIYNDTMKTQVLQEMKSGDVMKLIDDNLAKAKVVKNEAAINHYNPKNLKDK
jgi:hypothetical protein